jgi:hypothetical protein
VNNTVNDQSDQELHELFRGFLIDGNPSPLVDFIRENPAYARPCSHRYPACHRISDFEVGGRAYRVCRCLTCGERLFVLPIPVSPSREPGTPYELCASALVRWVQRETEKPTKGPQNWSDLVGEPEARTMLLNVLRHGRRLLARPDNDFRWSRWHSASEAMAEVDTFISQVEANRPLDARGLSALFAATGQIQQISLSSGWSSQFLRVAARLDSALAKYEVVPGESRKP